MKTGLATLALALGCLFAAPGPAEAQWFFGGKKEEPKKPQPKSEPRTLEAPADTSTNCGYTLFTPHDDVIDFAGGRSQTCFDMLGGNDVLVLERNAPEIATRIFTGLGRDIVRAGDGPDLVVSADGRDQEIRTFAGDDTVRIDLAVEKDPRRRVTELERTDLFPGPGSNEISIGENLYSNAFARMSPNLWVWPDRLGRDRVRATCGRPGIDEIYDLRLMDMPQGSEVDLNTVGCGTGIFGMTGTLKVGQLGGRFTLSTIGKKFAPGRTDALPVVIGEVRAGQSAFLELSDMAPQSRIDWDGARTAVIKAEMTDPRSGGDVAIVSDSLVRFSSLVGPSTVDWRLASRNRIEISLETGSPAAQPPGDTVTFAAPNMAVEVNFGGSMQMPVLRNKEPLSASRTTATAPDIDFYGGMTIAEKAKAMISEATREKEIGQEAYAPGEDLPEGVAPLVETTESVTIAPGRTTLTLIMRRDSDPQGACGEIEIVDFDGRDPNQNMSCSNPANRAARFEMRDATRYDEIIVRHAGQEWRLPINEGSDFRVDEIAVIY